MQDLSFLTYLPCIKLEEEERGEMAVLAKLTNAYQAKKPHFFQASKFQIC